MLPTIRRATPADAAALAALAARTFRETFGPDNQPEDLAMHLASAFGLEQQGRELADPDVLTLVGDVSGTLVAYAQLRRGSHTPSVHGPAPIELWRFYVSAEWQGRGLAQRLMAEVQREARGLGAATLWLGVWEHNPRAIAFYAKQGFVKVGAHSFVLGTDEQADFVMAQPLDAAAQQVAPASAASRAIARRDTLAQHARLSVGVSAIAGGGVLLASNLTFVAIVAPATLPWVPLAANVALLFGGVMFLREYRRSRQGAVPNEG